jgi:hypothetical protein
MISLNLSGCSWFKKKPKPEPIIEIRNVYHYTPCAKDNPPNYVELDLEKHIGSSENVNKLIGNVEIMEDYTRSLINTIDCYETQAEKSDESN